jgi:prepilin-type N-terminal cleavage/methylation domain-containing protein
MFRINIKHLLFTNEFERGKMMKRKGMKGFTLVELIVVIAIIAVLSAVSIIGFSGFIDQARFSNDVQAAGNMNNVFRVILAANPEIDPSDLDAHDVRELINENSAEEFDFTTRSRNGGFFYLKDVGRIVAAKFDDIGNLNVAQLFGGTVTETLNATLPNDLQGPEALFGNDRLLMSTGGSPISNIVFGLRSGFSHVLLENYNNESFKSSLIQDNKYQDLLELLLDEFDPDFTLYVNNVQWRTNADITNPSHVIRRVTFSPGIRNIPTFGDYLDGTVNYDGDVLVPKTVRTIEKYAFIQFENTVNIAMNSSVAVSVTIHNQAFRPDADGLGNAVTTVLNQTEWNNRLLTYLEGAITVRKFGNDLTYDFTNLPNRNQVVGYSVSVSGNIHTIRVYTINGLAGIAEVQVNE